MEIDIDGVKQVVLCAALDDAAKLYTERATRFAAAGKHVVANANLASAEECRQLLKAFQMCTKVVLS